MQNLAARRRPVTIKHKIATKNSAHLLSVAALRCGKAVQMHYQFVVMHCLLQCLYFRTRKQNIFANTAGEIVSVCKYAENTQFKS